MKTTIRIFATLVLLAGFAVSASAQQTDDAVIQGRAEVVAQVVVNNLQNLSFGMVTPGVTKTISTLGTVIRGTSGVGLIVGNEAAGRFSITKGANTQVTLTWNTPTVLTRNVAPNETMPISFADVALDKMARLHIATPATNHSWTLGQLVVANTGDTAPFFAATAFDVFVGGSVSPVAGQVAGVYEGNITLTATYN